MAHHNNRKMRFDRMLRAVGPFVAMAAMSGFAAASRNGWKAGKFDVNFGPRFQSRFHPGPGKGGKFRFNGREGVPLDQLDMDVEAPTEVILSSGDNLEIVEGADFAITLQGSKAAKDDVRFVLEDGALFVMRGDGQFDHDDDEEGDGDEEGGEDAASPATITVTMPAPRRVTLAGSGRISTDALADKAEITIAGSGRIKVHAMAVDTLSITIAGSGTIKAGGTAKRLEVSVAGSGSAKLGGLMVDDAEIDIAGSGSVTFASDGTVNANIMGSGNVTVRGGARCSVHSMGSGSLVCERGDSDLAA
jgi:hypothetical protein